MTHRIKHGGLQIAESLYQLINNEVIPGTGVTTDHFWSELEAIVNDLRPVNKALLVKRDQLQASIDSWHRAHPGQPDITIYKQFLTEIGYLVDEGEDFVISTEQVEPEIAEQAGPQLVVPILNARFALNAANARWGSLYDALYGTDVIAEADGAERSTRYNPERGNKVITFGREFLDNTLPLAIGSHARVKRYFIKDGKLRVVLIDDAETGLADDIGLVGYRGDTESPSAILFCHHTLHIEVQIDRSHHIGKNDAAGVKDILLEAALTTIMDCEDSVVAVSVEDKCSAYRNWLGLMKGDLQTRVEKSDTTLTRRLNPDREYRAVDGSSITLPGRSMMFIRNVGHLMTSPAIVDNNGDEIPEGILDGIVTALIAMHDLNGNGRLEGEAIRNSRAASINIVKPKMHGPEEVAFANKLFNRIENALGIAPNTLKMGIMDEERRTSVNLKACIRAAKDRVVFINTGFLDRTGDEIHTSMEAGAFAPKAQLKSMPWITAYEDHNVDIGLACGLAGKAQIGKGMWPEPDNMAKMMVAKLAHPTAGANTAWVPSPTAATLHALHYHQVDVFARQQALKSRKRASVDTILTIPLLADQVLSADHIQRELDNNCQGILGYVVRWIDQGIGCSKVPDSNNIGLMEDRATLRISSQHVANWLRHGVCTREQVEASLKRMAAVVDQQNASDSAYTNMAPSFDGIAFEAACALIFEGCAQPNGYTEPLLHHKRKQQTRHHID